MASFRTGLGHFNTSLRPAFWKHIRVRDGRRFQIHQHIQQSKHQRPEDQFIFQLLHSINHNGSHQSPVRPLRPSCRACSGISDSQGKETRKPWLWKQLQRTSLTPYLSLSWSYFDSRKASKVANTSPRASLVRWAPAPSNSPRPPPKTSQRRPQQGPPVPQVAILTNSRTSTRSIGTIPRATPRRRPPLSFPSLPMAGCTLTTRTSSPVRMLNREIAGLCILRLGDTTVVWCATRVRRTRALSSVPRQRVTLPPVISWGLGKGFAFASLLFYVQLFRFYRPE